MRNLLNGRDLRIREDVALDPGIGRALRNIATDGMVQEQAVVGEQPTHVLEVRAVIAPTDVLEHPERVDAIESSLQRSVILQQDGHRQALAARAGGLRLIFRDRHARHAHTIPFRGKLRRTAPPTADIEHAHTGLETKLAANQVELGFLCAVEIVRIAPVSAAVDHARVEHTLVQVIADVIVLLAHLERAARRLTVDDVRLCRHQELVNGADLLLSSCPKDAEQHLIQLGTIPLSVHVRFANAECAFPKNTAEKRWIVDLDVPGIWPIELHSRSTEQRFDSLTRVRHVINPLRLPRPARCGAKWYSL